MAFHVIGKSLLQGDEIIVYGDGMQTRDFTYVDDVVEANLLSAATSGVEGQVFNIAGGSRVSLAEVIGLMESLSGKRARVRHTDVARGDARDTYADTTRARKLLGYAPRVALREGLAGELAFLSRLYMPSDAGMSIDCRQGESVEARTGRGSGHHEAARGVWSQPPMAAPTLGIPLGHRARIGRQRAAARRGADRIPPAAAARGASGSAAPGDRLRGMAD
jgi:hypothetical protein